MGKKIESSFLAREYVDDEVVFELVKKKIGDFEKENKNWVIEGFPRNKNQALMVGKMGIIPDKMVLLNTSADKSTARIKQALLEQDPNLQSQDLEAAIKNVHQEYNLNILGVKEVFKKFLFEIDTATMEKEAVEANLICMLKLRFSK
jgi:adenylate kinase family enzyme